MFIGDGQAGLKHEDGITIAASPSQHGLLETLCAVSIVVSSLVKSNDLNATLDGQLISEGHQSTGCLELETQPRPLPVQVI